jgi:hypothetical protein
MQVITIPPQLRSLAAALQGYGMLLAWCFFLRPVHVAHAPSSHWPKNTRT